MLSRYYDFLAGLFAEWFKDESVPNGSRYQLTLDSQQEVDNLFSTLAVSRPDGGYQVTVFDARPELDFRTPLLKIGSKQILLVKNDEKISLDFLVTLRNRVADQQNIWQGKSIVFISSRVLDSILGGAMDISSDGGPFSVSKLKNQLSENIKKSKMRDFEKNTLKNSANTLAESDVDLKLMDFEDVYGILEQGVIKSTDFSRLGLFADRSLETISDESAQQDRIKLNSDTFKKIADMHTMSNVKEEIDAYLPGLSNSISGQLADDSKWMQTDFNPVLKALNDKKHPGVTAKFITDDFYKQQNGNIPLWHRTDGETKVKSRNHNIIAFVQDTNESVSFDITLPFDGAVTNRDFTPTYYGGKKVADQFTERNSGKKHIVTLNMQKNKSVVAVKLVFKQNDVASSKQTFKILAVRASQDDFTSLRAQYLLKIATRTVTLQVPDSNNQLCFTASASQAKSINSRTDLSEDMRVNDGFLYDFSKYQYDDDETISFALGIGDDSIQVELVGDRVNAVPADPNQIDIDRRSIGESITFDNIKQLNVRDRSVYTREEHRKFLDLEQQLVASPSFCVRIKAGSIEEVKLELPQPVSDAINRVRETLKAQQTLPSLANVFGDNDNSHELNDALQNYVDVIRQELESLEDGAMLSQEQRNIAHIGNVERGGDVYYSPMAPMNMAYFLATERRIENEQVPYNVNKKLTTERLVPYIQRDGKILAASTIANAPHWVLYHSITTTGTDGDIADLVASRVQDFISNFSYMFKVNPNFALHVAVRNIVDHQYIFMGIINSLIKQVITSAEKNGSLDDLRPVELYFDDVNNGDAAALNNQLIRDFFAATSLEYLTGIGTNKLTPKALSAYSKRDILSALQRNIKVYNGIRSDIDYHITFYQFEKRNNPGVLPSNKLEMNTELDGALSTHEYTEMEGWGSGFGTRGNASLNDSAIVLFASDWNALVAATRQTNLSFQSGLTVFNTEDKLNDASMDDIFKSSDWVTFIDPRLIVDAFNRLNDLYVIHYTDHDVTSNIDSITVTKRVDRYNQIIRETLLKQTEKYNNFHEPQAKDMGRVISSFNLLNGVWLLEILNDRMRNENRTREKLSIIAAYKLIIGLLDTADTFWVPISLEEVLRISGGSKLSKRDSILDGAELQKLDSANDDLLFMGVQFGDDDELTVHVVPAEIKIGVNAAGIITKAKSQVVATLHFLENELVREHEFANDVARNFFIKLYLNNLNKIITNSSFESKHYEQVLEVVDRLKNGHVKFTTGVDPKYGEGFIVNFGKSNNYRGLRKLEGDQDYQITEVDVPESDGYVIPSRPIEEVVTAVKNGTAGFSRESILEPIGGQDESDDVWLKMEVRQEPDKTADIRQHEDTLYEAGKSAPDQKIAENQTDNVGISEQEEVQHAEPVSYEDKDQVTDNQTLTTPEPVNTVDDTEKQVDAIPSKYKLSDVSIPLGHAEGSNQVINWEYGNHGLANRHMLVSGKSGQGKTYFLQGTILEMAKRGISSLVIDYTNSYTLPQLDPLFKEKMKGKINQLIVYKDGISLNPFKRGTVDLGLGEPMPEDTMDMIDRVAQTFDFVFKLGVQQRSILMDAIKEQYAIYKEGLTFEQLGEYLKEGDSQTLYGRIRPLFERKIFNIDAEPIDWNSIFANDGKVTIIQLAGLQDKIQSAITEFVLWNLVQFAQNSNEGVAKPIFLDEIQNLNFTNESPTVKILREGRKFGLSGIFATQSLSSVRGAGADSIWNAAIQMHFLPPEDQIQTLSKAMTSNASERPDVESKLRSLQKGHALMHGPILGVNGLTQANEELSILQMEDR